MFEIKKKHPITSKKFVLKGQKNWIDLDSVQMMLVGENPTKDKPFIFKDLEGKPLFKVYPEDLCYVIEEIL